METIKGAEPHQKGRDPMAHKARSTNQERYLLLRTMLEERRREVQDKLRSLREAIPVDAAEVRDAEERSVDDFVTEVDFALMQMKSETLKRIDQAMSRLEQGTYGRCEECDGEISANRLSALPFAALCRNCQENAETTARAEREARAFARLQKELVGVTLRTGGRE
jgi:DnaK suppressor protein